MVFLLDINLQSVYIFNLLCVNKKSSGSNSVVECQLPKLDVAGSNPVSRSTNEGFRIKFIP